MSRYEFPAAGIPLSAALLLVPAILFYGSSFVRKTRLFDSLQRPYSEVMLILQQLRPRNRTEYKNALTLFLLITVCIAASRAFTVLEPLILRTIVDKLSMRQQSMPWKLITTFVILSPLRDGFWYAQWALALRLETTVHAQITTAVYDKLMDLPASYHDNKSTITEWQTICDSANSISRLVRQLVLEAIPTVLDLAVAVIAFSHVCGLRLAFVLVCVLGTWLLVLVKTTERDEQGNKEWLETWETKDALASNALSNWWTAHLFGRTECEKEEHRKAVQRIKDVDIKITDTQWLNYNSKHMALSSGLLILCLLVGNDIWKSPDSSAGDLVMFLAIWKEVVGSVQQISEWTVRPNKISKYAKEALAILRPEHNYGDRQSAKDFNFKKGNIKFSNVTFSYDETCPGGTALQDISFEVEGGKMVSKSRANLNYC